MTAAVNGWTGIKQGLHTWVGKFATSTGRNLESSSAGSNTACASLLTWSAADKQDRLRTWDLFELSQQGHCRRTIPGKP